jgi:hypothetical protein
MSVCTKGVVVTPFKNVMLVCCLVESALNTLISTERKIRYPDGTPRQEARERYRNIEFSLSASMGMVRATFTFDGDRRSLSIFFDCDSDHSELAPRTLSMSMGCSGESELFVKTTLHALSILGPAYFDENDCDDIELAPLLEPRPNIVQAVALGYLRARQVDDWAEAFDDSAGLASSVGDKDQFFGASAADLAIGTKLMSTAQDTHFKELASAQRSCSPSFLADYHQRQAMATP